MVRDNCNARVFGERPFDANDARRQIGAINIRGNAAAQRNESYLLVSAHYRHAPQGSEEHGIGQFTVDGHRPVAAFDVLGVSFATELGYTNLLSALDLAGIPLAAVGKTYVALIPSMGDMPGRWTKLMLCETWPFSMDYWRSLKGIDVPDFERLARIKHVMHRLGLAEPPDTGLRRDQPRPPAEGRCHVEVRRHRDSIHVARTLP